MDWAWREEEGVEEIEREGRGRTRMEEMEIDGAGRRKYSPRSCYARQTKQSIQCYCW